MNLSEKAKRALRDALCDEVAYADMVQTIEAGTTIALADNAKLKGTYNGTVFVSGNARVAGVLVVKGSLIVQGDLINDVGVPVTVYGDVTVTGQCRFTPREATLPQGDFLIWGDFRFGYGEMGVNPGQECVLYVHGDMIGMNYADFYGIGTAAGAPGLQITVDGNLVIEYMELDGANAGEDEDQNPISAGHGGHLVVMGSAYVYDGLNARGGSSNISGAHAGDGGYIEVHSKCTLWADIRGGSCTDAGNGGNGGAIECYADLTLYYADLEGGACSSQKGTHRAGSGGYIYCSGDIDGDGSVYIQSGYRNGTLDSSDTTSNANGGHIEAYGDVLMAHVDLSGVNNDTQWGAVNTETITCPAATSLQNGEYLVIWAPGGGPTAFYMRIDETEPTITGPLFLSIASEARVAVDIANTDTDTQVATKLYNAISAAFDGGVVPSNPDPGLVGLSIGDGIYKNPVNMKKDDSNFGSLSISVDTYYDATSNSVGAPGGWMNCKGDAVLYNFYLNGGNTVRRDAGNAGTVTTKGKLQVNHDLGLTGGNTDVGVNGSGGNISAKGGLMVLSSLYIEDGTGTGDPANGGSSVLWNGTGVINNLVMPEREGAVIRGRDSSATLQIAAMSDRVTLSQPGGEPTADISPRLGDSMFIYNPSAGWCVIQGEGLGVG